MAHENFTTYTKVDEGGAITVDSATKVSWVDLRSRSETGYLYDDKGVDHFSGDFTHKFEMLFSIMDGIQLVSHWVLANGIGDLYDIVDANGDAFAFDVYDDTEVVQLRIVENGSAIVDTWAAPGPQLATIYFVEIVRDDDGGANSTGRLTAYIRTGSHSGALQDTLVLDSSAGEQNDFRYIYPVSTYDSSGIANRSSGFTQNLDIGEANDLDASDVSSNTQITVPLIIPVRNVSASNIESLSQITAPTVGAWTYPIDVTCDTEVTALSLTVKRQLTVPNIECLTQVTAGVLSAGWLYSEDLSCNTEITAPSFSVKRALTIPDIESSTEISAAILDKQTPLNASDISSDTEVTVASIYKELLPSNIECSSEVEAADLEWIKILKLNATLPMITAEMSGGHGGFLNVELPMITAEMRAGARLNVTLPMITAELEGRVGVKADLNVTLPMITAEMIGTVEVLGELNVTLPMITARMSGTAGHVGQLNVTLPMITAALTGYTDIDGQLNVTLPMIEARLTGTNDRFAVCTPLRYEEPDLE